MTVDNRGELHFGKDILGLFGLVGIFVILLSASILFKDLGAGPNQLAPLNTLVSSVGLATGSYATYIVGHVIVRTRGENGGGK